MAAVTGETAASPAGPERLTYRNPYSSLPNWLYPTFVAAVLGLFGVYAVFVVFFQTEGRYDPYLSPFYSPFIKVGPIPPAIWIAWIPGAFRATCYYYRKAYFRAYFWHPRSCAVPEPHRHPYRGERALPWILNNFHRYAFYLTVVQVCFLFADLVLAFNFHGHLGVGVGTLIMGINVFLLAGYTFGCHACRHLVGGGLDCFSCNKARFRLWKGVTVLNVRHDRWAWFSLFSVLATDVYIRLLIHGTLPDIRFLFT